MKEKPTYEDLEKRIKELEIIAAEARLAQAALAESEEKFAESFLRSPIPMAITATKDGRYLDVNEAFAEVMGLRREEICGNTSTGIGFITPEQRDLFLGEYRQKGAVHNLELQMRVKDGQLRHGLFNSSKISIGMQEYFLTMVTDITERKLIEDALARNEERFRAIFNSTYQFTGLLTPEGTLLEANRAALDFAGIAMQDVLNRPFWETHWWIGDDKRVQKLKDAVRRAAGGEFVRFEIEHPGSGDALAIVDFSLKPVCGPSGEILMLVAEGRNISERRRAEKLLADAEREKAIILDTMSEIVVYVDREMNVLWANRAMYDSFGLTPETFDGAHCYQFHKRKAPCPFCPAMLAMETGKPQVHDDLKSYGKRWVLRGYPIRDEKGDITGAVEIVTDVTEARNALDALKESEQKYRLLADRMTDIVWTGNLDLQTTYVSPSIESVLGITPEERTNVPFVEQVTGDSFSRVIELFADEMTREESGRADPDRAINIELEYYNRDGDTVWLENIISAIRDDNGRLTGMQGVARDITKRRRAEKLLADAEREKAIILDTMSEIVVYIDREMNVLWANRAMYDSFGLTPETFDGTHCYHFHKRSDPCPFCPAMKAMETGEPQVHDDLKSYGKRWVLRGYPVRDENGNITGAVEIVTDVTEARNALDALKESEEKYRALAENAAMAIIIVQDARLKYANPYTLRTMGYTAEEIAGTHFIDVVHPDDREMVGEIFAKRVKGQQIPESYTARVVKKTGEILWGDFSGVIIQWEGRPAVLMLVRDITVQKLAEKKLIEERRRLFSVLDGSPINTFVIDRDRRVTLWNLANEFTTGISEDAAIGREIDLGPIYRDRKLPTLAEIVLANSNEEITRKYAHRGVRKSTMHPEAFECVSSIWIKGVEHIMAIQATRLRDREGNVIGAIQCAQDITEKTVMEKALATEHQQLASILDGSPISTFVIDRDGRVIIWNTANEIFTGLPKEDALGKPLDLSSLYNDKKRPALAELVLHMTDNEILARFGKRGVRKSSVNPDALENMSSIWIKGQEHIMNIQAIRLRNAQGEVTGAIQCAQDVTEQKKMEEEKIQKEKLQSILEMAGAICHEMHQPMQIILGQSELLCFNMPEDNPLNSKLNIIQNQIQRMNDITGKLRSIHNYRTKSYAGSTRIIDIHGDAGLDA